MDRVIAKNVRKALLCLFMLAVFVITLPKQSAAQTPLPSPTPTSSPAPDVGVPETTVTDGDTMITTDINGVESSSRDSTTLAIGSPTVSPTSQSSNAATTTTNAAISHPFSLSAASLPGAST